jgi:twitching motility two-component system response regulator PilG
LLPADYHLKARMVGATDYLTKPFNDTELLMIVKKHLQNTGISQTKKNTTLVDCIEYGVKNNITELAEANNTRSLIKFFKE